MKSVDLKNLPSIGDAFECMFTGDSCSPRGLIQWRKGDLLTVIAHVVMQGSTNAVFWNEREMSASTLREDCYRPIRTPDQIAAEARSNAIAEMACIVKNTVQCGVNTADMAALYDAGYRKTSDK